MVVALTKPLFFAVLVAVNMIAVTAQAKTQNAHTEMSVFFEEDEIGRLAILSGRIIDVEPHEIIINHEGREISIERAPRSRGSFPDFHDYFTEGMYVTVEGVVEEEGKVVASRVTRGLYYDMLPY